jgi:hypothetical protein
MRVWKLFGTIRPPRGRLFALQAPERPQLVPLDRVNAWRSPLGAADVQAAGIELDLVPLQIADLGRPQAVPIGNQDHGCIAMTVPARLAGRGHQFLDLVGGEIFPGAGN